MASNHSDDDGDPTGPMGDVRDRTDSLKQRINEHTSSKPSPDGNNNKKKTKTDSNSSGPNANSNSKSNTDLRDEYIKSLNCWMTACTYWKMYHTMVQTNFITSQFPVTTSRLIPTTQSNGSSANGSDTSGGEVPATEGTIYKIPDVWKRVVAELIDFFLLLLMKVFVTYMAIDFLDVIDVSKFDFSNIDFEEVDTYQLAIELTSEILVIESVHRFIVIIYETIFLMRNLAFPNDGGGSTPGKKIMGLRVISCSELQELPGDRIKVTPGGNIGFWFALLRAMIKNFSSIFFLPASLTVFVSIHNRAAYDIACRCIVVEDVVDHTRGRRR